MDSARDLREMCVSGRCIVNIAGELGGCEDVDVEEILKKFKKRKKRKRKKKALSLTHSLTHSLACRARTWSLRLGPFMLTNADMLVEACIEFDCDYVDVNGRDGLVDYSFLVVCGEALTQETREPEGRGK